MNFLIEDASASDHTRVVLFCFDFVFYMVWIEILIGFFHDWWFDKLIFITSKYIDVEQTNWTWRKLCKQYTKLRLSFHFLLNDFTLQLITPTLSPVKLLKENKVFMKNTLGDKYKESASI